ncbi:chromatin assembly factor 1 subunit B-like isoform X2 [Clavelina lepadiformis]|uniref:chromatin assembly factor 1 subunit B-like isoform X2 n=1 Tax=Clavelina lepadiformis TaxID=159417 RepID=UPI00404207C1
MRVVTPEISWHAKEAVFSIDVQPCANSKFQRLATAGLDGNVRIWKVVKDDVMFLSNLSRHDKAVNVVRFSHVGNILASAGDDGSIILWRLSDKEEAPNIFEDEDGRNIEIWNASKIMRGHIEDINDLSWSYNDLFIATGSVDHSVILWDTEKGQKLAIFSDSKHFVNGVAWDPLGKYVAALSCDRSLRIYNMQSKKLVHCVNKIQYGSKSDGHAKSQRIFHDETVVRRRLCFTVDGKILITPAGCLQTEKTSPPAVNTTMMFTRGNLSKPSVYLPGLKEPASVVACCPVLFQLRKTNGNDNCSMFKLEYRNVFAVSSSDTILLYDTQQSAPFAIISNIHYASITDLNWSSDASFLAVSSRDGFCSIIHFGKHEIGERYTKPKASKNTATTLGSSDSNKSVVENKPQTKVALKEPENKFMSTTFAKMSVANKENGMSEKSKSTEVPITSEVTAKVKDQTKEITKTKPIRWSFVMPWL